MWEYITKDPEVRREKIYLLTEGKKRGHLGPGNFCLQSPGHGFVFSLQEEHGTLYSRGRMDGAGRGWSQRGWVEFLLDQL